MNHSAQEAIPTDCGVKESDPQFSSGYYDNTIDSIGMHREAYPSSENVNSVATHVDVFTGSSNQKGDFPLHTTCKSIHTNSSAKALGIVGGGALARFGIQIFLQARKQG